MLNQQKITRNEIVAAVTRLMILLALCLWAFWPEISAVMPAIPKASKTAHSMLTIPAILLLIYLRRKELAKNMTNGSAWGIVVLVLAIFIYASIMWPFSYAYLRNLMIVPILCGIIWATCGRRVMQLSLPMLLLVFLASPIPSRLYATLIIRPETYTIASTANLLDNLPNVDTYIAGVDISYSLDNSKGIIALGESNRGARLLLAFMMVGLFVTFSRARSFGRIIFIGIAAIPIILFCNFLRFFCWGLVQIYTEVSPINPTPRNVAAVCSMLLLYLLFVLVCTVQFNLFVEVEDETED